MPETLKRANVKVKVNGQFQDVGLLQSDVATQLASEIATRQSNDNSLEANKIPYPLNPNSKYGNPGDVLRTDGAGGTKWVPVGQPTDEQTQDAINNWLDAHPEATTTVENGSLTEAKFADELKLKTIKDYVTPEMFGAVGDGTTDDSGAIKNTIEHGGKIIFENGKTYCIHNNITINTPEYADVDFNGCILDINAKTTFNNISIDLGEYSYSANDDQITIANHTLEDGIFWLLCPEVEASSRTNANMWSGGDPAYRLGFSSWVFQNKLESPFPYDVSNANAKYFPAKKIILRNISDIKTNSYGHETHNIAFEFKGIDVILENLNSKDYDGTTLFTFFYSKVDVHDCVIRSNYTYNIEDKYYYGIVIACCSNWKISNVVGQNSWHTITTGYSYGVSMNGCIDKCTFIKNSYRMMQFVEHENSFNTKIIKSTIDGVVLNSGGIIENSDINFRIQFKPSFYSKYAQDYKIINSRINIKGENQIFSAGYSDTYQYEGTNSLQLINCNLNFLTNSWLMVSVYFTNKITMGTMDIINCDAKQQNNDGWFRFSNDLQNDCTTFSEINFIDCKINGRSLRGGNSYLGSQIIRFINCLYIRGVFAMNYVNALFKNCIIISGVWTTAATNFSSTFVDCIVYSNSLNSKYVNCVDTNYTVIQNT